MRHKDGLYGLGKTEHSVAVWNLYAMLNDSEIGNTVFLIERKLSVIFSGWIIRVVEV